MSEHPVKRRKKLIEVAIPLEAINDAAIQEKFVRQSHPSTLHLWWARRPLAAARAVIFCQMVDDPSAVPEEFPTEEDQENERIRLFALISELVEWKNIGNEQIMKRAREEIFCSWRRCCSDNINHPDAAELFNPEKLPGFHDPFAGGGALPLEAQRLGLDSHASDLNPVAVLINKAMIEIPPKFAGLPPVNPDARIKKQLIARQWKGAQGLAEDVRYYGKWMRDEAEKRIGHLYPKVKITPEMVNDPENPRPDLKPYEGQELTVIAWLWARTVKSPNPAFSEVEVPLASTFMLSTKAGKEAYVEPVIEGGGYRFTVKVGKPEDREAAKSGTKLARGANFKCVMTGAPIESSHIYGEALAGRMGARLMAVVAEGQRGRIYLAPTPEHEAAASQAKATWKPEAEMPNNPRWFSPPLYGLTTYGDLFTNRQLEALNTFFELAKEAGDLCKLDTERIKPIAGNYREQSNDSYAQTISLYLSLAVNKLVDRHSTIATWDSSPANQKLRNTFARQSIPMTWDFGEGNPFCNSSGTWSAAVELIAKSLTNLPCTPQGYASQEDAAAQKISSGRIVSTDPPYFDNIGYADLSDYFYTWLRRQLKSILPELFPTLSSPKDQELIASPYRHGGKAKSESFFLNGMKNALQRICVASHPAFPTTIYYAFKQSEKRSKEGKTSTGWEAFLEALISSGFALHGTWPVRTESANRILGYQANALASSMVLVCHKKSNPDQILTRNEFRRNLRKQLPPFLRELEKSNIAPVDVAQAALGPGIAIYSNACAVLNPDDSHMTVRSALLEINSALDEYLSQGEINLDSDTSFAVTLFESFGFNECVFGDIEGLAKARNVSVAGVANSGILRSVAGKVRLLQRSELEESWDPTLGKRICIWEATQHLIRTLETDGEVAAAALIVQLKNLPGQNELLGNCKALAYRLYSHCEKTTQVEEARAYNGLVIAWPELERLASNQSTETAVQASLI